MIKYVHTNIITDDWRKLADFYIKLFGCKPLYPERDLKGSWLDKTTAIENAHITGIHLALPGYDGQPPTLEIFQYDTNIPNGLNEANHKGFGHIAFEVDNIREVLALLLDNGGSTVGELAEIEIEGVGFLTLIYARDIDGNIIELQSWR
jgi:catechol 2,3-dioxygenase-like lactoylglutathione lyase family enzyme